MDLLELETQLASDTAQEVPPFAARSIELAREVGPKATSLLLAEIRARGDAAFLALEALRKTNATVYNTISARDRAEIYTKSLSGTRFFNTWGIPGHQLSPTSEALIDAGNSAVASLTPLLTERRLAPLRGSHEGTMSTMYQNRVCDYAWVLINEIIDRPYAYSKEPGERDKVINALLLELQNPSNKDKDGDS